MIFKLIHWVNVLRLIFELINLDFELFVYKHTHM